MRVLLGLALLFLLIQPAPAQALSCASLPSPKEAYRHSDAVVVGSVKQVEPDGDMNRVQLTVTSSYKGIGQKEKELTVMENATWGAAWGPSAVGETYLYYLKHTADGWENPLCAPSRRIADAQDDLIFLRSKTLSSSTGWTYAAIGAGALIVLAVAGIGWIRRRRT